MKDKFIEWFSCNRKTIGYTIGGLNVFAGVSYLFQGQTVAGLTWVIIGGMIIFDTWKFK